MGRAHLLELEDQPWFPAPIRDAATDYLQFVVEKTRPFRAVAPRLAAALRATGATEVVDLCSGAGGPWPSLIGDMDAQLPHPLRVRLTDRYPNLDAFRRAHERSGGRIGHEPAPVDATAVPEHLDGFRTLFNGFHHFAPAQALGILRDAVRARRGIGVFELVERRPGPIASMAFTPLAVLLATPAIRPFRWSRLLWTYLLPAVPAVALFDGFVSCLRVYSPAELRALVAELGDTGYHWEIGREKTRLAPGAITYLLGWPERPA